MRSFRPARIAAALALAFSAAAASAQFTNTYVFGDSLSDAGQYGARFTTNPGLVTPMYVGQHFGLTVDPSFTGGLDYAQGGARVNSPSPLIPPSAPNLSIAQQVNLQLAKTPELDPERALPDPGRRQRHLHRCRDAIPRRPDHASAAAGRRRAGGARPRGAGREAAHGGRAVHRAAAASGHGQDAGRHRGRSAGAGSCSRRCRRPCSTRRSTRRSQPRGVQVIQFNTSALLNEIIANPSLYGFVNATNRACTTTSSLNCTPSNARRAQRQHELRVRRRRAPDHRRRPRADAGDRVDDHGSAADGGARPGAARRRARELAHARQPHAQRHRHAGSHEASSRRGPRTTTRAPTFRARACRASGDLNTVAVGGDIALDATSCSPASSSPTPSTRATSATAAATSSCASR